MPSMLSHYPAMCCLRMISTSSHQEQTLDKELIHLPRTDVQQVQGAIYVSASLAGVGMIMQPEAMSMQATTIAIRQQFQWKWQAQRPSLQMANSTFTI